MVGPQRCAQVCQARRPQRNTWVQRSARHGAQSDERSGDQHACKQGSAASQYRVGRGAGAIRRGNSSGKAAAAVPHGLQTGLWVAITATGAALDRTQRGMPARGRFGVCPTVHRRCSHLLRLRPMCGRLVLVLSASVRFRRKKNALHGLWLRLQDGMRSLLSTEHCWSPSRCSRFVSILQAHPGPRIPPWSCRTMWAAPRPTPSPGPRRPAWQPCEQAWWSWCRKKPRKRLAERP